MSTPSGKPFDPNNPSAFAPRRTGAQPGAGEPRAEDEAAQSPYAPKRLRVVHPPAASDDVALPQFLFEANKPRPPLPGEQKSPNRSSPVAERPPTDLDDIGHPLDPSGPSRPTSEAAPRARDARPPQPAPAAAARPADEPAKGAADNNDGDIERLEASLRWLKRQDTDLRQQRTSRPVLPPEPRPAEARDRRPVTRAAAEKTRTPKPLEPESLLAPALRRQAQQQSSMRGPLMIAIAGVVALPIAYLAVTAFSSSDVPRGPRLVAAEPETPEPVGFPQLSLDVNEPQVDPAAAPAEEPPAAKEARALLAAAPATRETIAVRQPAAAAPAAVAKPQPAPAPAAAAPAPAAPAAPAVTAAVTPAPAPVAAAPTPAAVATAPAAAPAAPPAKQPAPAVQITRQIDPAEIKILVKQGEDFVAAGDMVAARVVFRRAAEAGDAGAAMALGATYDPLFLAKLSVLGVPAEPDKARTWYQRAKDLGSQEAPRRLELLANR